MRRVFTLLFGLFICTAVFSQPVTLTKDEDCHASVNGKSGEISMTADMVIRVGEVKCDCKEWGVMSFDMIITVNSSTKKFHSSSSSFTNTMKKLMEKADKIGYVTLTNVKVCNTKGDEEYVADLAINLK